MRDLHSYTTPQAGPTGDTPGFVPCRSFDAFMATAYWSGDLRRDLPHEYFPDDNDRTGWIYAKAYCIENNDKEGYTLAIERDEYATPNLYMLEQILWAWAVKATGWDEP